MGILLICIFLLIIGIVIGYFKGNTVIVINNQNSSLSKKEISNKENSPTPTINLSQIKQLRVYDNSEDIPVPRFDIEIPNNWTITQYDPYENNYIIQIQNGEYILKIIDPWEGGLCQFPDSYQFNDGPVEIYNEYEDFKTSFDPTLRFGKKLSNIDGVDTWYEDGCSKDIYSTKTPTVYLSITPIGHINLFYPKEYDPLLVKEMKQIIKNISLVQTE